MKLTKYELMETILSVHALYTDFGTEQTEHDKIIEAIHEDFTNRYDYDEYGKEATKKDTEKLLNKLINLYQNYDNKFYTVKWTYNNKRFTETFTDQLAATKFYIYKAEQKENSNVTLD